MLAIITVDVLLPVLPISLGQKVCPSGLQLKVHLKSFLFFPMFIRIIWDACLITYDMVLPTDLDTLGL